MGVASSFGCEHPENEEQDFSDEDDEPTTAGGPQPGNNITFPDGSVGKVLRRTASGFKVRLNDEDESEKWFPLSGLEGKAGKKK